MVQDSDIGSIANLVLPVVAIIDLGGVEVYYRRRENKLNSKRQELVARRLKEKIDLANRKLEALREQGQRQAMVELEKVNVQKRKQALAEAKALGGAFKWFLESFEIDQEE
jgi:nitrogen-specific signal transduction histidine kinase